MKKVCLLMLGLALTGGAAVADELEKGFATPPDAAKNQIWWHWLQGNVTREGITADLEAMKSVGVGGAQIFNLSEELPAGPAPFMSPQWLELVKYAAAEAERLGLELGIQQAGGWSNSGGPWIKPEQAMEMVTISETRQQGPVRFDGPLKQPETRSGKGYENGFYRDIAVLAFPTPHDDKASIERFRQKALFDSQYGQMPQPAALPPEAAIPQGGVINLTEKLAADGRLVWDVPAGDWTILRIGYTLTGAGNLHSPVSGQGLECDKLSAEAFDAHWAGAIEPILQKLGPLAGPGLQNCLIDSYEVGSQNWTPRMREEFRRRCGYDLLPFLPALTGRVVVDNETSERFLWDFRRVQGDLFAEYYYQHFSELCRKHGLKSALEPYDGPFECLQVGAKADVLMGEFWVKNGREEPGSVKLAASSAHTHGIGIVGAEAFTAMPVDGKWKNHPAQLKRIGDLVWSAGVNRLRIHRYAHQPWLDKYPGMTMGYWGMHFERTVTWWEQSRAWLSYCARSQYLLQQGRFAADGLVFAGEASPNGMLRRDDLKAAGYDYDVCGSDLIASLGVKDWRVTTPVGPSKSGPAMSYRLLVLPDTTWMGPKVARKIRALVKGGAKVLGEGDPAVILPKQLRVWCGVDGIPKILTVREDTGLCLPRDVTWDIPAPAPRLITNNGTSRLLAWESGTYSLKTASGAAKTVTVPAVPAVMDLAGPWQLALKSPVGAPPNTTFNHLISLPGHTNAAIKYFSGAATYRKVFDLPLSSIRDPRSPISLDLGRVEVIAEARLNGKDLGILRKPPFRLDVSEAVRSGANELEVRVTNLWPNRLIGDEQFQDDCDFDWLIKSWPDWLVKATLRPSKDRVTFTTLKGYQKDSSLLPSGLLGPVTIRTGAWVEVE